MNNSELTKKELQEIIEQYKETIAIQEEFIEHLGVKSKFDEYEKEVKKDQQTILENAEALRVKENVNKEENQDESLSASEQIAILEGRIKELIKEYCKALYPSEKYTYHTPSEREQIENYFIGQLEETRQDLAELKKQEALSKVNMENVEEIRNRADELKQCIPKLKNSIFNEKQYANFADSARVGFREELEISYGREVDLEIMKEELEELQKSLPPEKKKLFGFIKKAR